VNILLYNTCSFSISSGFYYYLLYFFKFFGDLNALTSVCVLTWFYYPYVLWRCRRLIILGFLLILSFIYLFFLLILFFGTYLWRALFLIIINFFCLKRFFSFVFSFVFYIIFKLVVIVPEFMEFGIL